MQKKIRDDDGYWQQVDQYLTVHSAAELSHGMCRQCSDDLYGGQDWYEEAKRNGEMPDSQDTIFWHYSTSTPSLN